MIVIIWGVSGAGKTTVGKLLAKELGWKFIEGDDFHSAANIEKMKRGEALTDEDRQPWLARLCERIEQSIAVNENAVLACSALKKKYRDELRVGPEVRFVFLRGACERVSKQLQGRRGHFFDPKLLDAQFADLEEPQSSEEAITIDLDGEPGRLVQEITRKLMVDG